MSEGRDVKAINDVFDISQEGVDVINALIVKNREGEGPLPIPFSDVRQFFAGIGEHKCTGELDVHVNDIEGTSSGNTFVGFECKGCGLWFLIPLYVVKAIQRPLRPYIQTTEGREEVARRFNEDPEALLLEMRNSGGWAQPDPGVAFMTALAAACEQSGRAFVVQGEGPTAHLHKMMKGDKPQ